MSLSNNPFFSICIPAYNCGDIVYDALRSVLNQTCDDWQVVVVDDGSTDNTASICENQSIIPSDKYLFVNSCHSGLFDTRRKLLDTATGNYIVSLDADDALCDVDALAKIKNVIECTGCDFVMYNATRSLSTRKPFVDYGGLQPVNVGGLVDMEQARRVFSASYLLNNIAFKAYKKDLMRIPQMTVPIQMTEDRLQSVQLFLRGESCALINEPLYYYKPSEKSITEGSFDLRYVRDQLYVESEVDILRQAFNLDMHDGDRLIASNVTQDLRLIRRSWSNYQTRLAQYREVCEILDDSDRQNVHIDDSARLDRRMVYWLFVQGRFRVMDMLLGLLNMIKSLTEVNRYV